MELQPRLPAEKPPTPSDGRFWIFVLRIHCKHKDASLFFRPGNSQIVALASRACVLTAPTRNFNKCLKTVFGN
eukprot:1914029-Alexandrium_andersonii.AAC.1